MEIWWSDECLLIGKDGWEDVIVGNWLLMMSEICLLLVMRVIDFLVDKVVWYVRGWVGKW